MEPVVNGLENDFGSRIEFRKVDANSPEGMALFRSFNLRGHPSFVLINPDADVLWSGIGEHSNTSLAKQINRALGE